MKNDRNDNESLSEIIQNGLNTEQTSAGYAIDEEQVKQALLKRPSFSVKTRLILIFLTFFLIVAGVSITTMLILSGLNDSYAFVTISDKLANEIQHARRSEKNFFLYGTELSEVSDHVSNADSLLKQASRELSYVVGMEEIRSIQNYLARYQEAVNTLMKEEESPEFKNSEEFQNTAEILRSHGTEILALSLDISNKERQKISSVTARARRINYILIFILLLLSIFIATHIYRHIISRLSRLMEATQRFAEGDFLPITPKRKYKDEFSHLAIALNHMMYELDKRQNILVESHKMRAIGNLTAGIAHELNNPLNNIILTTEVLRENYQELSREDLEDIINDLSTQGERAHRIVKNLLDFARESETHTDYFHIERLLDETVSLAKNQIKLSKIKLEMKIEENLPPLYGDLEQLKQVFLNIILNAIDAMPNGGVINIRVDTEKDTGFMSIRISDTGDGIPPHILGSIFNPFFTTKQTGKGTGLGLAVSRGIIEKHGGDIDVQSKYGEGATFNVHLPIVPIPADIKERGIDKSIDDSAE